MKGAITKKDFFKVWQAFGFRIAIIMLFSKADTALLILTQANLRREE